MLAIRPHAAIAEHVQWIRSEAAPAPRAEKVPVVDEGIGDEMYDDALDSAVDAPDARDDPTFAPVSQLILIDATKPSHLELAAHALAALERAPAGRIRLGVLHNPAPGTDTAAATRFAVGWSAMCAEKSPIGALRRLIALQLLSLRAGRAGADLGSSALGPSKIAEPSAAQLAAAEAALAAHRALIDELDLPAGDRLVLTNGRAVRLDGGAGSLDAIDLALLAEFEFGMRARAPSSITAKIPPPDGATAEWRSDVHMFAVAEAARSAVAASTEAAEGRREYGIRPDQIECGPACVRLPGEGVGEALELMVVLDPLTKEAQRFAPTMMALRKSLGLTIILHLNPALKISSFPLESFYRYVVTLTHSFDEAGASLAPASDRAVFSSLRTPQAITTRRDRRRDGRPAAPPPRRRDTCCCAPQVLTLHVDAPEAWLVESTEATYDMDNIRLSELGEKRSLSAR